MLLLDWKIPAGAKEILYTLHDAGFQAYLVGGCVRDSLLGRVPGDWDIATSALPAEVDALFLRTAETGIRHGTVTVILPDGSYEVTTFRVDGQYSDGRRPDNVRYTDSMEADLSRRDFTVNAMAWHPEKGLLDPFRGLDDLNAGIIRTVGLPAQRFGEDALRLLRAVRFSAQLGFRIEDSTLSALTGCADLIRKVSQERVRDELTRLLVSREPEKIALLYDTGLLSSILPEFIPCFTTLQNTPWHIYNVAMHSLHAVSLVENTVLLRWVLLLHDTGKPSSRTTDAKGNDHFYGHPHRSEELARKALTRLRFDNAFIDKACKLVRYHDITITADPAAVRKAVCQVGKDLFPDLLKVIEADKKAQNPVKLEDRMSLLHEIQGIYADECAAGHCLSLADLAVNGKDLLAMGIPRGPQVGRVLEKLLEAVVSNPALNTREQLLKLANNSFNP